MADLFVVCEGEPGSFDVAVLKKMLVVKFRLFVGIHAGGGDRGLRGVCAYLKATRAESIGLTLQDRNYRPREDAERRWKDTRGTALVWSRHEIENYLLHPRVVARAFERLQSAASESPWVTRLPRDEATILRLLKDAARPLLDDHAARSLSFQLYAETTYDNPADFRTREPPLPFGRRAAGRDDWLPALQLEATRVRAACRRVSTLDSLDPARIEERFEALLAEVHEPAFLDEERFLSDMGGKELFDSFVAEVRASGVPAFKRNEDIDRELVEALADVYQPDALFEPDDFDQLRQRLQALSASAGSS